jgi:penicillin-binding protein 2
VNGWYTRLASTTGNRADRFLPPDPRVEEPYLFTPRMALRVAILGAIALAVFAVLLLRLWSLQVLSGSKYEAAARNNQLRTFPIEAQRGPILDRTGRTLVTNAASTAVDVVPIDLPKQGRYSEMKRLSMVLNVPLPKLLARLELGMKNPLTPVTMQVAVHPDQVAYLAERNREFPGVQITPTYLRKYNTQALLAHVLGYVGEISPGQLTLYKKHYKTCQTTRAKESNVPCPGDRIGQAGVEQSYDKYLRGRSGEKLQRVDSLGGKVGNPVVTRQQTPGFPIRLTIDISLQRAAERALQYGINLAHQDGHWLADGGAIVAMNPSNGEVLAMASSPTYKPSIFVGRTNEKKLAPLLDPKTAKADNYPGLDRVTEGLYPPGSTFKPVTALAAMQERLISPFQTIPCTPSFEVHGQVFKNWDPYVNQPMTMPQAIGASCDTYFYNLGYAFYALPKDRGHPLQGWASRFGFGAPTGIDVGPEQSGLLPTPEWRQAAYTPKTDPRNWAIDSLWKPGDSIQLAIGQKDLLVTPLQMVRFYSLIANGGKLVTPHVLYSVDEPGSGRHYLNPPAPKSSNVDPAALAVVRDGLYRATHASYGTATAVFGNFPIPIAGKTGTAEKVVQPSGYSQPLLQDQSWWCGYGPADATETPKIAVCAVIENGGHGGTAAAPAALKVFEHFFHTQTTGGLGPIHSD